MVLAVSILGVWRRVRVHATTKTTGKFTGNWELLVNAQISVGLDR